MEITISLEPQTFDDYYNIITTKSIGHAGKYLDHSHFYSKHAKIVYPKHNEVNAKYTVDYIKRDTTEKIEKLRQEEEAAFEFSVLAAKVIKTLPSREVPEYQAKVLTAIKTCIKKGYLEPAKEMLERLANKEYETAKNPILARVYFTKELLKQLVKSYAKMTRFSILRASEMVKFNNVSEASQRTPEAMDEALATHQELYESITDEPASLTTAEVIAIDSGLELTDTTKAKLAYHERLKLDVLDHTDYASLAQKLIDDVYFGTFGKELQGEELYSDLADIYNKYMDSSNHADNTIDKHSKHYALANYKKREYANTQRVYDDAPEM